jgi:glycosyltransferase involved in cell wall biosynthesis
MSINIVVGARFNAGIVAEVLVRNKMEMTVYTSSPSKNWGTASENTRFVPMPFRVLASLAGKGLPRFYREKDAIIFDKMTSLVMKESQILHGWASFSLASGAKQKKQGGVFLLDRACPHVRYQSDLLVEEAERLGMKYARMSPRFMERMEAEYHLADRILVPSTYTHDSFLANGILKEKLSILRLDASFIPKAPRVREENRKKELVVGSIGGSVLRKGFLYLVEAWQKMKLKNARLLIKTSWRELEKIPQLARMIENDQTIQVVGYMKTIEAFYEQCDLFCLPSIDDGFGMVVLEALACGLPVVTTANVGASEFIHEGGNGYVVPIRDTGTLADRLQQFSDDPALIHRMSVEALASYEAYKESTVNYETSLLELYGRCL